MKPLVRLCRLVAFCAVILVWATHSQSNVYAQAQGTCYIFATDDYCCQPQAGSCCTNGSNCVGEEAGATGVGTDVVGFTTLNCTAPSGCAPRGEACSCCPSQETLDVPVQNLDLCCAGQGQSCSTDGSCCNAFTGLICPGGTCVYCVADEGYCRGDSDCCNGVCVDNVCGCHSDGDSCSSSSDCCNFDCNSGTCTQLNDCRFNSCSSDGDCNSGSCADNGYECCDGTCDFCD